MKEIRPTCISSVCQERIRRNKGMEGNTEIGVVIDESIRMCYLTFTYIPVSTASCVFIYGR